MLPGFFFLAPWIVYFPVIGLLINMFFGRRLGERGVAIVAILGSGLPFIVSLLLAYSLGLHPEPVRWMVAQWIHIGSLQLDWTFRVDTLSVTMMLVVSTVGTLIHIYAVGTCTKTYASRATRAASPASLSS
jgi:NADH-quinone oxidoreductase subunit L